MFKFLVATFFSCLAVQSDAATLMVQVDFTDNKHQITSAWLVKEDLPGNFRLQGRKDDVQFDLLDENNGLISSHFANQPTPIYGAYILATEKEKQQLSQQLNQQKLSNDKGSYYLRVPNYQPHMKAIQLSYQPRVQSTATTKKNQISTPSKKVIHHVFSLASLQLK